MEEFYHHWQEKEDGLLTAAKEVRKLARTLGVPVIPIQYADLVCQHGQLPKAVHAALGYQDCNAGVSDRRILEKMTAANPATAIQNRADVAAYFEKKNKPEIARRLMSLSETEKCSDESTVSPLVWQELGVAT